VIFLTKEEDFIFHNKITCIYFYASWMIYHKKMLIMIDKIEKKHPELLFYAIDVDFFKTMCTRFNVKSIPDIVVYFNNKEQYRINGAVMTSAFKTIFSDICNKYSTNLEK
jgi:thiol-disulfide isomerase/thioredoxin